MTAEHQKQTQQFTIGYMRPVLHPITETATVQHCIRTSVEACAKLNQKFTFITMDLAAAKIAYDIKWNDPDEFQNVIIHLGAFHTMCSYIGALGHMIVGSGFEEVVLEAGICAIGSLKTTMSGKHYNRAMRVHQLINDAIQRLMLQAFIDKNPDLELLDLQQ
jgi:hypothetical protein